MSRHLTSHLQPSGANNPPVLDSDGQEVRYTGVNRITDEGTVVDIGTSPNSNDGDPLRTAFLKINNFIEASYWTNSEVNEAITQIQERGPFLGVLNYSDLPSSFSPELRSAEYRIAVLRETLSDTSIASFGIRYPLINSSGLTLNNGRVILYPGTLLSWNETNDTYDVVFEPTANLAEFSYADALDRLRQGTAESGLTANQQQELFNDIQAEAAAANQSYSLQARNVEDAIVEMNAKLKSRGMDAGYYG